MKWQKLENDQIILHEGADRIIKSFDVFISEGQSYYLQPEHCNVSSLLSNV